MGGEEARRHGSRSQHQGVRRWRGTESTVARQLPWKPSVGPRARAQPSARRRRSTVSRRVSRPKDRPCSGTGMPPAASPAVHQDAHAQPLLRGPCSLAQIRVNVAAMPATCRRNPGNGGAIIGPWVGARRMPRWGGSARPVLLAGRAARAPTLTVHDEEESE